MTYRTSREKTLKVMQFGITRPTTASQYNVGAISQYTTTIGSWNVAYTGNLSGITLNTHTNSNDTLVLSAGRYFIQSVIPTAEPDSSSSMTDGAYVEWKNFSSSSLNGTYSSFGTPGRNNPGHNPNDTGDDAGVYALSTGIVESTNTIYLQIRIVTNSNYTTLDTGARWSSGRRIMIWRAD